MIRRARTNVAALLARRRGVVLIVVLVVVMMLSLAAYTYTVLMRSHREASVQTNRQAQARLMVDSAVEYVRIFLSQPASAQADSGGRYNNPSFKQLPIVDDPDPQLRGYATVVAPALDDEGNLAGVRTGLEDESARLNLNTLLIFEQQMSGSNGQMMAAASTLNQASSSAASGGNLGAGKSATSSSSSSTPSARQLLMALPSMTETVADSILDWLDADDEPREYGAESDYYASLDPPYACKNGPLDTVEELLRVKGVTPQLLFGSDTNRNGQIDANERSGNAMAFGQTPLATQSPATGSQASSTTTSGQAAPTGSLDRGWSAYLTLHSRERNLTPEGKPRIYINNPDLKMLYDELSQAVPQDWATFIVAYRQGGAYSSGTNTTQSTAIIGKQIDFNLKAKTNFTQVLDLIGAATQVKFSGDSQATIVQSPLKSDLGAMNVYMGQLMDQLTVNPAASVPGRININQAPAAVLRGIPGIDEATVEQILSLREPELNPDKPNRRHETWLLTESVVTLQQMKLLQPFINSGGSVYRGQVVGYFQNGEASARAEVIFDATGVMPRLVLWRDMSHLGRGYALETLGIDYSE
jgi:type II secretory pathway component PulK